MKQEPLFFHLPYNGDPDIIDIVCSKYTTAVKSFYGSFNTDKFGGGRALEQKNRISLDQLTQLIEKLNRHNIEFNYVLNNTNMLNREYEKSYQKYFLDFVSELMGYGIKIITLSNIFFIQLTKAHFPNLKISASVNLKIRSVEEFKFIKDLGIDDITLHYDLLKNFPVLSKIRQLTDIPIKLIPNDVYIMNCPWQKGHTRMQGAHSRKKTVETPYFSYYRNKCVNIRHYRPDEITKAMWIAPNHLHKYVAMGYKDFKLLDRLATTEWNLRCLDLYIAQKPVENMELFLGTYGCPSTQDSPGEYNAQKDNLYPREKLEVIPKIKSTPEVFDKISTYYLSEKHPQECGTCHSCQVAVEAISQFSPNSREQAILNNKKWQAYITKREFIERLSGTKAQRIKYV